MAIELRGNRYFASLIVPKDVRAHLKRSVFREKLGTDNKAVARVRAQARVAAWKIEIERARGNPNSDDAAFWRGLLRSARGDPKREASVLEQIEMAAWNLGSETAEDITRPFGSPEVKAFAAVAFGSAVPTGEFVDEWLKAARVKPKTERMRRSTITRLAAKFPHLSDIKRPEVVRWAATLQEERLGATVQRLMSDCRSYWQYLQKIEEAPAELKPFDDLGVKVDSESWLPYTPEDAVRLFNAAAGDQELRDTVQIAMYTGMRREEICALKLEDVKHDRLSVADAKTPAGVREVPMHSELAAVVARLRGNRKHGYLFHGMKANQNDDRGDHVGKRFGRLKTKLGFGPRHVMHSFRGTVITMLEHAGVPEPTVQDLVGHSRSTLTGQTYSGKSTFAMRWDAVQKLSYPSA
jgi:integrase